MGELFRRRICLVLAWVVLALALRPAVEASIGGRPAAAWVGDVAAQSLPVQLLSARARSSSGAERRPSLRAAPSQGARRSSPEPQSGQRARAARLELALAPGERLYLRHRALLC